MWCHFALSFVLSRCQLYDWPSTSIHARTNEKVYLQLCLGRSKKCPVWVIDQIQGQAAARAPVAGLIERPQTLYASLEDPSPPLLVHITLAVAWQ